MAQISASEERRLAAILSADAVGYSRLMAADEAGTLARLKAHRAELIDPAIAKNHGRLVKTSGDGLLVEFASAVAALDCALEVQRRMAKRNSDLPADKRLLFRVGINIGEIIVDGDDIHGDGVNLAARLQALADAGGICVSADAYTQLRGKTAAAFDDLGAKKAKAHDAPTRVFRVRMDDDAPRVSAVPRRALMLAAAAVALLLAIGAWFALDGSRVFPLAQAPQTAARTGGPANEERQSIAVLAFANLSNDPEQEYFADGIAEDILTTLSRFGDFKVIARNSSFRYKGQNPDIRQIGRELGVRYVLEGSVRRDAERLRITAQLIDTTDGKHVWSERYDRPRADFFAIQDEITTRIATALGRSIARAAGNEVGRMAAAGIEKFDAYDLTLLGRNLRSKFGRDSILKSREVFERAIERDPAYAPAWVGLVTSYYSILSQQLTPEVAPAALAAKMLETATQGLALDPKNPYGHAMYGAALTVNGRFEEARAEVDRVAELNPNDSNALSWSAEILGLGGDHVEAVRLRERVLNDDPFPAPVTLQAYGRNLFLSRRYEDAVTAERRCIATSPQNPGCHVLLAAALAQLGRLDEARRVAGELQRILPSYRISAEHAGMRQRYRLPEDADHVADGLRKAGVPE